jgi:hypothetical protein
MLLMKPNQICTLQTVLGTAFIGAALFLAGFGYGYGFPLLGAGPPAPDFVAPAIADCP